jgi:hypothetical protein
VGSVFADSCRSWSVSQCPAADHRRYLDVALARAKAASGFVLGWLAHIIVAIVLFTMLSSARPEQNPPAHCQSAV